MNVQVDDRQQTAEHDTNTTAGRHKKLAIQLIEWDSLESSDAEEITADALLSIAHCLVALNDTLDAIRHHLVEGE